eukprot:TRINITY_DN13867_c0_g3_i1.p1 TRINITY_DN13867_c0_g3~~TRINITY_DN13867_c0_g3_i1.p1  ORF type:complete len:564 (-),score=169.03 TRINITY_DN13867_c0_g3_i1:181-1872(-)
MEVTGIAQTLPEAKSNFEAVFNESKQEVQNANRTANSDYKAVPLEILHAPALDSNPQFSSLKEWMIEFNSEIQNKYFAAEAHDDELHLRVVLYRCLNKLFREIIVCRDKKIQEGYIKRVYNWFSKRREKSRPDMRRELGLPSNKENIEHKDYLTIESKQKLYEDKKRTVHPEIPPPKDRLGVVEVKTIKAEEAKAEKEQAPSSLLPSLPLIQDNQKASLLDKEKTSVEAQSTFIYYKPRYNKEQQLERLWHARKNQSIQKKREGEELSKSVTEWGFARSRFNENIARKHENKNYANNFFIRNFETKAVRPKTTLKGTKEPDYKGIYNGESSGDENEEVRPFTSKTYVKSAERRRVRKPLPDLVDLSKCDINEVNMTAAQRKARLLAAKRKKKKAPKKVREVIPRVSTAVSESGKSRISYIRRMYGHLIGETNDSMDSAANIFVNGPKGINSLSIYNKDVKRPYTVSASMSMGLNADLPITHQGNREQFRVNQMKEVNTIKEYLAKEEVPCNITALQRAILMPEDYAGMQMKAESFLQPGSRLIVNPFAKKKKKKGKKKKGKRR